MPLHKQFLLTAIFSILVFFTTFGQQASLVLPMGHTCQVTNVAFSPDGRYLFSRAEDYSAKLWETETGFLIHDFKATGDASMSVVRGGAFDRYGKNLLVNYEDRVVIWDLAAGKPSWDTLVLRNDMSGILQALNPVADQLLTYGFEFEKVTYPTCIFNKSEKIVTSFTDGKSDVTAATFNQDGTEIATASEDGFLKRWNASTGKLLRSIKLPEATIISVMYAPDNKNILLASEQNCYIYRGSTNSITDLKVPNLSTNNSVELLASADSKTFALLYSFSYPDENHIDSYYDSLALWDASSGKLIARIGNVGISPTGAQFIVNNRSVATKTGNNNITVSNLVTGTKKSFEVQANIAAYTVTPDGKWLAIVDSSNHYSLFDQASGNKKIDSKPLLFANGQIVNALLIGPNGELAFTGVETIWTCPDFSAVDPSSFISYSTKVPEVLDAKFLDDNASIEITTTEGTIIWNPIVGNCSYRQEKHENNRNKLSYENVGNVLSADSSLMMNWFVDIISIGSYDVNTSHASGNIYHKGLKEIIIKGGFSPDGKKAVITMQNNTVKVVDLLQGKMLFNFLPLNENDFVVTDVIEDSLGGMRIEHFDGSDVGRKQLYLSCGTEIISLDQLKDLIWVPNLAERLLNSEAIRTKSLSEMDICGYLPLVEHRGKNNEADIYSITARRGGLGDVTLLINGTPTKTYLPKELVRKGNNYELVVPKNSLADFFVEGQENKITVKANTADNATASRGVSIIKKLSSPTEPPNLYSVMIGVSDYKGTELDLKYAAKDATELSKILKDAAKKLLNTDTAEHVFMYNMTTTADRYQLPEKKSIQMLLKEIGTKAKANDILVIFFAGHGVMTKQNDSSQFYFLTAEASAISTNPAQVREVGISTEELAEWMAPIHIKAQKRILIFDACNSGQAIRDLVRVGNEGQGFIAARNDDAARQVKVIDKLNEKSGLFILSASASDQNAYESSRYSQGFLTYALLKAIKERNDILEAEKYLDVSRWFNAAKNYVSEMADDAGKRQEPQIVTNTNFNIGLVDTEIVNKINLPAEKPLFTTCNLQNSDEHIADDDLGLNSLVNQALAGISFSDNSPVVFIANTNAPGVYSLSGRYSVSSNTLQANINLKKGKTIVERFEINGTKDDLKAFAQQIATKAVELIHP